MRRLANFFHVLNNMGEWHFSCRHHYNRAWLEATGPLSAAEEDALRRFTAIVRRFPYGDYRRWLGTPFITSPGEDQAWPAVDALVGARRRAVLQSVMAVWADRFTRLWEVGRPQLERLATRFGQALASAPVREAASALETYLGCPFPEPEVHLLLSAGRRSAAGGANEGPGHITLEAMETEDVVMAVELYLHEVVHLMEEPVLSPLLEAASRRHRLRRRRGEKGWNAHFLLREALAGALAPGGCLAPQLGRATRDHRGAACDRRREGQERVAELLELTGHCLPLVDGYLRAGRRVDAGLVEEACRLLAALGSPRG